MAAPFPSEAKVQRVEIGAVRSPFVAVAKGDELCEQLLKAGDDLARSMKRI